MDLSASWLAEYVDLPDDPKELQRRLTDAGFNVEGLSARDGDTALDVEVTTNRPDCMNHFGLAREIAVLYGTPLRRPPSAPGAPRASLPPPWRGHRRGAAGRAPRARSW